MITERLFNTYLYDLDKLSSWHVLYYLPFYILKWVVLFMPIFILVGGIYAIGSRNSKN